MQIRTVGFCTRPEHVTHLRPLISVAFTKLGTTRGTSWEQNTLEQGQTPRNNTYLTH